MQNPSSKCGTTGEVYKGLESKNAGHAQRPLQTGNGQTSGVILNFGGPTKHCARRKDWPVNDSFQAKSRMPKKHTEATGKTDYDWHTRKSESPIRSPTSSCSNTASPKAVATGMQIPPCLQLSDRTIESLKSAMRSPPVNVSTVGELNLSWMMRYVNLRCDINFDHDLHFTPIKGPRGEEKRHQAIEYWCALEAEFKVYQHQSRTCQQCEKAGPESPNVFQPRLSAMFQDLKDLLETLVPDKDHEQVAANLDIEFITHQVENGVLDVGRLSKWLAKLLKCHCAPMRDETAEAMAEELEFGANNGDLSRLMSGLERLFGFLEAMKLDVANHQIRTFRYVLIDETIMFQRSHFNKRLDDGKMNLAATREWYQNAHDRYRGLNNMQSKSDDVLRFEAFLTGLVDLCSSPPDEQELPVTLHYDQGRIHQLRADVQDIVMLRLCTDVFNKLLARLRCRNQVPPLAYSTLQVRLLTIADDGLAQPGDVPWSEKVEAIAVEITRAAFVASSFPHPPKIAADDFERTKRWLQDVFEQHYNLAEEQLLKQVAVETLRHAANFQRMSTLEMSETQKCYHQNRQAREDLQTIPDIENMARLLAHMGVIHWQVWHDLAYGQLTDTLALKVESSPEEQVSLEPVFDQCTTEDELFAAKIRLGNT